MFNKDKLKFDDIFENRLSQEEVKKYLIKLYEDGETAEQIAAAASAMREHLIALPLNYNLKKELIDVVGTGGDKSNSFNISSTVSLLLNACGCKVAKHGNSSITSKSGSADMLEKLGINLNLSTENQIKLLQKTGFVFMFAKNHHPIMKHIMPIRKSIPHRTIFNILGPLSNPAFVHKQLIGVFDKSYISKMAEALKLLGAKRVIVVSSEDGMDEISMADVTHARFLDGEQIKEFVIDPRDYGFDLCKKDELLGGDSTENAKITKGILSGEIKGAKLNVVLLNTAFALYVDKKVSRVEDGIAMARDTILSGKAIQKIDEIVKYSNELA